MALALPVIAYVAAVAGVGTAGFGALWAATNVIALVPALWIFSRLINKAVDRAGSEHAAPDAVLFREFWKFTAPRAVGQVSEVVVNWLDTVLVGGLVSARAAGIYGSGTRYLLPGQFTADALMQVSGSRVSGLLAVHKNRDAEVLLKVTTAWQSMITWPLYLIVACFSVPLLRVFGPEVVEAQVAVIALSMSMLDHLAVRTGAVGHPHERPQPSGDAEHVRRGRDQPRRQPAARPDVRPERRRHRVGGDDRRRRPPPGVADPSPPRHRDRQRQRAAGRGSQRC